MKESGLKRFEGLSSEVFPTRLSQSVSFVNFLEGIECHTNKLDLHPLGSWSWGTYLHWGEQLGMLGVRRLGSVKVGWVEGAGSRDIMCQTHLWSERG